MGRIVKVKRKAGNGEVWTVEEFRGKYELTDDERETVVRMCKSSPNAIIYCSDIGSRGEVAKIKKLKGVKVIEESKYGAVFELPKSQIKLGTTTRVRKAADKKTDKQSS